MLKYLVLFIGVCVTFVGCDAENVITDEETVVERWVNPVDAGKRYPVGDIEIGDTVLLSTGEQHMVGEHDFVDFADDKVILHVLTFKPGSLVEWVQKTVVPEGPPVVYLATTGYDGEWFDIPIRKDNNVWDHADITFWVEIDRVLDYNLPIYLEYQTQTRPGLGGEVYRERFLVIVPKGHRGARGTNEGKKRIREEGKYVKCSVSILPYTKMNEIHLPTEIEVIPDNHDVLPLEERIIPKGHVFRPYRIRSSSFLMGEEQIGQNL